MSKSRDAAVKAYMIEKKKTPGINPWRVFEAGWDAALRASAEGATFAPGVAREFPAHDEVRSSGWSAVGA